MRTIVSSILTAALAIPAGAALAQADMEPVNDLPNPYQIYTGWAKMPAGRDWGATSAVDVDLDGKSIWIGERCGSDSIRPAFPIRGCAESDLPVVLKFNSDGDMVRSFGGGIFAVPHGFHVDPDGNIWVTDAPFTLPPGIEGKGHIVVKFSPEGERLMTLGTPGVTGDDESHFNMPSDVHVAPNGDIFVADGHGGDSNGRIVKFDANGNYLIEWGEPGSGPGEFDAPHGLAMDSQGRLFVADRGNNRIQILSPEGEVLDIWTQFGRPSGIWIDENDRIFVADGMSGEQWNRGWERGIRIGDARTGYVTEFIPDYEIPTGSGIEFLASDAEGNIYAGQVGRQRFEKYVRVRP